MTSLGPLQQRLHVLAPSAHRVPDVEDLSRREDGAARWKGEEAESQEVTERSFMTQKADTRSQSTVPAQKNNILRGIRLFVQLLPC